MVWLWLLKVNFINHIGISLSLSFYKEFSTLHLLGNNPYGIELLRFMREKDYAFLDNNCNLDNRCRSIIWKEWLWWHSEFLAIFLFEHHRIYEKTLFNQIMKPFCINYSSVYVNHSYEFPFLLSTSQFLFSPSFSHFTIHPSFYLLLIPPLFPSFYLLLSLSLKKQFTNLFLIFSIFLLHNTK